MPYKLEKRSCRCGCGMTFRALPSGNSWYASSEHNPQTSNPAIRPPDARRRRIVLERRKSYEADSWILDWETESDTTDYD
jgi:hypothetical protein